MIIPRINIKTHLDSLSFISFTNSIALKSCSSIVSGMFSWLANPYSFEFCYFFLREWAKPDNSSRCTQSSALSLLFRISQGVLLYSFCPYLLVSLLNGAELAS